MIDVTQMREEAVEDDHRASTNFERCLHRLGPRRIVERYKCRAARRGADKAFLQSELVAARNGPHTAVILRGVFEGKPEPGDARRRGVKERSVLVAGDLAADVWLFED